MFKRYYKFNVRTKDIHAQYLIRNKCITLKKRTFFLVIGFELTIRHRKNYNYFIQNVFEIKNY